jgi:hypothetical protein
MEFYMPRLLFITSKLISLEPADLPPSLQHFQLDRHAAEKRNRHSCQKSE